MTAHEILIAAKAELLTRGWYQGAFENPAAGGVCAIGALNCAVSGQADMFEWSDVAEDVQRAHVRAWQLLESAIGCGSAGVHVWNDDPARTPEEVLQAFDLALALAETREAVTA